MYVPDGRINPLNNHCQGPLNAPECADALRAAADIAANSLSGFVPTDFGAPEDLDTQRRQAFEREQNPVAALRAVANGRPVTVAVVVRLLRSGGAPLPVRDDEGLNHALDALERSRLWTRTMLQAWDIPVVLAASASPRLATPTVLVYAPGVTAPERAERLTMRRRLRVDARDAVSRLEAARVRP